MAWPRRPKRPPANEGRDTAPEVPPEIPAGLRVYALGDVHGRADLLAAAFAAIDADCARRPVAETEEVLLGDLVDRGSGSKAVIELLLARREHRRMVALRGNHEAMFEAALASPEDLATWLRNGGGATLRSYGVETATHREHSLRARLKEAVPVAHRAFLAAMPNCHRCGDYLFVHAGIRPGLALEAQVAEDLLWIREPFLGSGVNHGAIVVHGHTPVAALDVRPNRINIDTGAFASGLLTCLVLEERSIRYMEIRRSAAAPLP